MTPELSADIRARLDAHLDAVEKVLIDAGRTREQRRAVLDDLESQIQEMLAARHANPTPADIDAVLGQIDPPSAYADTQAPASTLAAVAPERTGHSWAGLASLVIFCTAGIGELFLVLLAMNRFSPAAPWREIFETLCWLGLFVSFGGFILGIAGLCQKKRRRTAALLGLLLNGLVLLFALGWLGSASQ